jgi:hypothetical protein
VSILCARSPRVRSAVPVEAACSSPTLAPSAADLAALAGRHSAASRVVSLLSSRRPPFSIILCSIAFGRDHGPMHY